MGKYLSPTKQHNPETNEYENVSWIPNFMYTDPDGVKERQSMFNEDIETEGEYQEREQIGLTIGGLKTKKQSKRQQRKNKTHKKEPKTNKNHM
jgi:hypothetical protein